MKQNQKRGPSYWKVNTSYLDKQDKRESVANVTDNISEEFKETDRSKRVPWDILKVKIRKYSIYCKQQQNKHRLKIHNKNAK